jgi:hypothetical protein
MSSQNLVDDHVRRCLRVEARRVSSKSLRLEACGPVFRSHESTFGYRTVLENVETQTEELHDTSPPTERPAAAEQQCFCSLGSGHRLAGANSLFGHARVQICGGGHAALPAEALDVEPGSAPQFGQIGVG